MALQKILDLINKQERKKAALVLVMTIIMAILDAAGVVSVMPFIAVLANPSLVETNAILNATYVALEFEDQNSFLFLLGVLVFATLLISLAFKALTTHLQLRFLLMLEYSLSKRLVEGYLFQSYSWFLSRNSAELGKNILSEVSTVLYNCLMPLMTIISQGAIAVGILVLLILVDLQLSIVIGSTLSSAYALIILATRALLRRKGQERLIANEGRFATISEAFGAFKEVKVAGLEQSYISRFSVPALTYARNQATAQIVSQLPRFALEGIAFGGMVLVVLYLMTQSGNFADVLPFVALYAFAGYRLMPALQQIYAAASQMRFAGPALFALHADLIELGAPHIQRGQEEVKLKHAINLKNVNYSYPGAAQITLKNLCLTVPARSTVGLVGSSGSGKTTAVDLILGLIEADNGTLTVDDELICGRNKRAWQRTLGYVPQQIYLSDDTVTNNIAFGLDAGEIDQVAVERAAKLANIHNFIRNKLPQQYETKVGERGVRLSGGERQRIGIARALYRNPQILIMDEATSALDVLTEQLVMDAVNNLKHEITIILIAHRLSTVKECDMIFLMDKGEVRAQGSYKELIRTNLNFKKMVSLQ